MKCVRVAVGVALMSVVTSGAWAQAAPGNVVGRLAELVNTQGVSGYETAVASRVRAQLSALHPTTDNIGDVIVTVGTGAPHRLIVAAMDEPGFVVSEITADGYLRVQRLPQGGMPAMFNELASAQPVKIVTARGEMDGVFAGLSTHLQRTLDSRPNMPNAADLDWMYVDVGATSAAEARKAGVDLLEPLALTRELAQMNARMLNGVSVGDRYGAAAVLDSLAHLDATKISGTLTVAFVVQQRTGARGLQRILTAVQADELLYVGRLTSGGPVPGMEGVHHAPRRDAGSGVLLANEHSEASQTPFQAELAALGARNQTPLAADYSAGLMPRNYLPLPSLPAKWAHVGIAAAWPDTPAETVSAEDLEKLAAFLGAYETGATGAVNAVDVTATVPLPSRAFGSGAHGDAAKGGAPSIVSLLSDLTTAYGASTHEGPVRERVKALLPAWAKPETDDAGNLVVKVSSGTGAALGQAGSVLVVAHMDEIGYRVKTISDDGRLEVVELGSGIPMFFFGHPVLVHGAAGDVSGVMELPVGWDTSTFKWTDDHAQETIRVDVGARTAAEAMTLGLAVGDTITVPKAYRPLIGTRANARSFDDRVGCAALIAALWSLGGPDAPALKGRDVTFVFSTGEEEGLVGAGKMAARLADSGRVPATVFAVDTFVSSDSPLESKRYADAEIGKGFVVRAVDSSNIVPTGALDRLKKIASAGAVPMQYGVTSGGNDGSAFVRYGSLDVALGWPLRYSHSPAEVVDTRDVEALARIVAAVARNW
jgi:putative aminopeptidase